MQPTTNLGYLFHHISFVLDRQSDQVLQERLNIGFSQFKVLMILKWHSGLKHRQIAEHLGQTEASISRQIGLMGKLGLLHSSVSPANRRERVTTLTPKGQHIAEEAAKVLDAFQNPMYAHLSLAQQAELTAILGILHEQTCQPGKLAACNFQLVSRK